MKAIIFLSRNEALTHQEFATWWLDEHRPLAGRLPGLLHHAFNLLPEGGPFDAVVEQWFASSEAAEACYRSPEGVAVVADSSRRVRHRVRVLVEEHRFDAGQGA